MNSRERSLVKTLEEPARSIVFEAFKRFDGFLVNSRWRLSLPGRYPCRRTPEDQRSIFMRGRRAVSTPTGVVYEVVGKVRTYCDGYERKSRHQSGLAVDIGFRDTMTREFVWYVHSSPEEPHVLFCQLVAFLEGAGFNWAGYWDDPWDWHHFEMEEQS